MKTGLPFRSHLAQFLLEWNMFQTKVVQKIKTHILCSTTFFSENLTIYEIMWKNILGPGRPQMTTWHMRIACWIPKARNTHTGCVILIAFPQQQLLHNRSSVLHYTYIACVAYCYGRWPYWHHWALNRQLIKYIFFIQVTWHFEEPKWHSRQCNYSVSDTADDSCSDRWQLLFSSP